ncbi:DUF1444 family protein [Brevibacillus sp. DP1.3A]|uniref:DUF1444 family protein n=1 Tax=unclassified Brevibacillus TaxID=2684853 RepID=UPI00156B2BC3|nr:DUF1444 family protein [Brevibacillus sp. DP1.3A]UED77559.1 DUF1444 family protein [Brevibacillus sp. DP1.3A]
MKELDRQLRVSGQEHNIYPVLRHASMINKYPERWVVKEHTADTYVLYALDQGEGYALIEKRMLQEAGWTSEQLHSYALENLRKLPFSVKSQEVGGQHIHFISPTDGYAASRILLDSFLEEMDQKKQGDSLGVAIPHQDVLIVADMTGEAGAHLLARLTYDFASKGQVPISVLPFYWEEGELTPFLVVTHDSGTKIERK